MKRVRRIARRAQARPRLNLHKVIVIRNLRRNEISRQTVRSRTDTVPVTAVHQAPLQARRPSKLLLIIIKIRSETQN